MPEQPPQDNALGKVITFYSYKGGTGRTMALANTACLIAQQQAANPCKGVLVIDWDLEAPGLHRFFRNSLKDFTSANGSDAEVNQRPGLIDLFIELDKASRKCDVTGKNQTEAMVDQMLNDLDLEKFILKTDRPCLSILKAGRFDSSYASRVNSFQWKELHERSPLLIPSFAEYLSRRYDYVLIDSRTGLTDISGISTILMPEKLVIVFTPNRQSIFGVRDLIREAAHYRTNQSDDSRPLIVFPLASRIDISEPSLLEYWRYGFERKKDFPKYEDTMDFEGYQPLFQKLFEEVYELENCDLEAYFQEVQIQHVPYYAYGENIAVLRQPSGDRLSLTASYHNVVDWLVNRPVPWKQDAEQKIAPAPDTPEKIAEAAFQRLTVQEQKATQRLFTRLVRIAEREEGGENTRQRVKLDELAPTDRDVLPELAEVNLINIIDDGPRNERTVEASQEAIIRQWPRLKTWIDSDRRFLIWRQSLRIRIVKAADDERKGAGLLSGRALDVAKQYLEERSDDLNELEKSHIQNSIQFELTLKKSQRYQWLFYGGLVLLVGLILFISWWRQQSSTSLTAGAYVTLAQNYAASGDFGSAQNYYDKAIELNDKLAEAYYGRGIARYNVAERGGDPQLYNLAIADFDKAINLNSAYGAAHNKRGVVYRKVGKIDDAILDFGTAIKLDPDLFEAYLNLASGYQQSGESEKALAAYDNALSRKPDMAEGYNGRGVVYAQRAEYTKAIADFGKAIELKSDFAEAYLNRGKSFLARNDLDVAIADFSNAIANDAKLIEAYFWRGSSYLAKRDNKRALDDYRLFVANWKPSSAEDYFHVGLAYEGLDEHDRAIEAFNKAIELDPNNVEVYFQRGISFHKKGDQGSAVIDFQKALDLTKDPEQQGRARTQLRELGIVLRTPTSEADVVLYYEDVNDADLVDSIRAELNRRGFGANVVRPTERATSTFGSIKYFHPEDKENASQVHKLVEEFIRTNGQVSVSFTASLHGRFGLNKNVRVGRIEVWIPALQ